MYYNWKQNINIDELKTVSKLINSGEVIVFPTETVYGIGANALDTEAVRKIFLAKGRPSDNPLIVHVASKEDIERIAIIQTAVEQKLIDVFMPGPITIILKKKPIIPNIVSAGLDTVGIRMPSNEIAKNIIMTSNVPIAAPSANISGRPSGTKIEDIRGELEDKVSVIIDGGNSNIGLESTVVKVIDNIPVILRPGKVTPEEIQKVIGKVKIDQKVFEKVTENEKPESPGMKYRHYAPKTKCKLFYSQNEELMIKEINEFLMKNENAIVLGYTEHKGKIKILPERYIEISSIRNMEEYARNIYTYLRKADKLGAEVILIEGVENKELGIAIMNRLLRTCEYDYKEIND